MKRAALCMVLLALSALPVAAQQGGRIAGRVIERGGDTGIAGATVAVGEQRGVTDLEGRFTLSGIGAGRHVLSVAAFGYASRDIDVTVPGDTSLVIELDPAPVALDPLEVRGRTITVRGEIYERGDDRGLIDVDVLIEPDHEDVTNAAGRFSIDDVPAGPPLRLSVRGFGYMPIDAILSAFQDTTLIIHLEPDPLMQRMIDVQVERIEKRAKPFDTAIMPAMDRDYLLRNHNTTALDLIRFRYGRFLGRVSCIMIDDRQSYNGLEELVHFLPDELERVEVLFRGSMLRIYTRDYIREMVGGGVELAMPVYVEMAKPPFCR